MQIPDPNGMDLDQWVYGTLSVLTNYPNPRTMVNDDWRQWGMMFFDTPSLSTLGPPNPYDYAEWRPWAERLAESLGNAPGSPTPITKTA
jgi:hypothetical protein